MAGRARGERMIRSDEVRRLSRRVRERSHGEDDEQRR
jgi:hypothetical protein